MNRCSEGAGAAMLSEVRSAGCHIIVARLAESRSRSIPLEHRNVASRTESARGVPQGSSARHPENNLPSLSASFCRSRCLCRSTSQRSSLWAGPFVAPSAPAVCKKPARLLRALARSPVSSRLFPPMRFYPLPDFYSTLVCSCPLGV